MFFIFSKVLSFFLVPVNCLFTLTLLWWLSATIFKKPAMTKFLARITIISWLIVGYYPVPDYLLSQLENKYPQATEDYTKLTGVIVLGGAEGKGSIAKARNEASLTKAAERVTEAVKVYKSNPSLKILYTGFTGQIFHEGWSGADIAKKFFIDQGVSPDKIILEERSRNTYQNALYARKYLEAAGNEGHWGLITSAAHMNRSMKIFNKVGLGKRVTPLPVDYETSGVEDWWRFNFRDGNDLWRNYLHETVGTLIYRLTGRL